MLMWVKIRLDQLSSRCDVFCKLIDDASSLSLDYWLLSLSDAESKEPSKLEAYEISLKKGEARLRAMQIRLQGEFPRLEVDLPNDAAIPMRAAYVDLVEALTGGSFGERNHKPVVASADATAAAAAFVVRYARQGRDDATSLKHLASRQASRALRTGQSTAITSVRYVRIKGPVMWNRIRINVASKFNRIDSPPR